MTYLTLRRPMRNPFSFHNFGDLFASHEGGNRYGRNLLEAHGGHL